MSNNVTKKIICGCDDGHDSVKANIAILTVQDNEVIDIETKTFAIPSKVLHGAQSTGIGGEDSVDGGIYTVDDVQYTVSDSLGGNVIDTRSLNYPTSAVNRVLVNDVLLNMGLGGCDVVLTTGLPLSDFYLPDASPNRDLIERKRANLLSATGPIKQHMIDGLMPNIVEHNVMPEGVGAVYDMAVNENGTDNEEFFDLLEAGPVGVIDIGGKTIDLAVATMGRNGIIVDMSRSVSINFGMLKVMESINDQLKIDLQLSNPLAPRAMLRLLKTKQMMFSGKFIDVSKSFDTAVDKCWTEMCDLLRSRWGHAQDLSRIVVAGGGAYTFSEKVKSLYPQSVTSDKPEFANARGMLKLRMLSFLQSLDKAKAAEAA